MAVRDSTTKSVDSGCSPPAQPADSTLLVESRLTPAMCHNTVPHMKKTTIRELKHEMSKVLSWVAAGESVEVHRRDVPVAVLNPPRSSANTTRPDFASRLKSIYGARLLPTTGSDIVSGGRGDR